MLKKIHAKKNAKMSSNVTLYGEWYLTQTGLARKAHRNMLKFQEKHHKFIFFRKTAYDEINSFSITIQ